MGGNLWRTGGCPLGLRKVCYLDYVVDESVEVDECCMSQRSGAINKSEIVESGEAHFGKTE